MRHPNGLPKIDGDLFSGGKKQYINTFLGLVFSIGFLGFNDFGTFFSVIDFFVKKGLTLQELIGGQVCVCVCVCAPSQLLLHRAGRTFQKVATEWQCCARHSDEGGVDRAVPSGCCSKQKH